MSYEIRLAETADSEAILNIYRPYVEETPISFETEVPTLPEFESRVLSICRHYPYLVCLSEGVIVGYAYASQHKVRMAYRYDVEVSVYVSKEYHGTGVANKLYRCLFELLKRLGYVNVYAGYHSENKKSERFHAKFGFRVVGTYHKTGYKLGRWHDTTWLELFLGEHLSSPGEIREIHELSDDELREIFSAYIA